MLLNYIHLPIRKYMCGFGCGGMQQNMNGKSYCCPKYTDATEIGIFFPIFFSLHIKSTRFPICMSHHHLWLWWDFVWHQQPTSTKPLPQNQVTIFLLTEHRAQRERAKKKTQSNRVIHLLLSKMKSFHIKMDQQNVAWLNWCLQHNTQYRLK